MCVFTPEIKLSYTIYDVLFRTPSYLCVCSILHVCMSKNTIILVTEFIYNKTDLFIIIIVYITAEVYFGYIINYCEANRLKFGAPGCSRRKHFSYKQWNIINYLYLTIFGAFHVLMSNSVHFVHPDSTSANNGPVQWGSILQIVQDGD